MWGTTVGYLHQGENGQIGFQYNDAFLGSGIEISPIKMPLSSRTYRFPTLPEYTYHGLPGLVADSLPDKFGSVVMNAYLQSQGKTVDSLSVVEKLCYTGKRGMGALEYEPAQELSFANTTLDIDALAKLASDILTKKENFHISGNESMIAQLMECSSSVGGARAKTLIAWNQETGDVRSGQINAGKGYEYWLLKFGNVENNKDRDETPDDLEYTRIEYAYYLMATAAGIKMSECRLYEENGTAHFLTKRFDRVPVTGEKLHMQTLCALAHLDFRTTRVHTYEETFSVMRKLRLPYQDMKQLFRRMVFSEYAKNYDDHTKNISFLMNKRGEWSLSPAYDMTFAYKADSIWVNAHQMLINGKADSITVEDFQKVATFAGIKKQDAMDCIEQVRNAVSRWEGFASESGLSDRNYARIQFYLD